MVRDYRKERTYIREREVAFKNYLEQEVLSENSFALFKSVAKQTDIYVLTDGSHGCHS